MSDQQHPMSDQQQPASTEGHQAYSSVSVTKNTRGYSWEAKVYVPIGEEDTAIPKLINLELGLREIYGGQE